jgi:two-component system chemotaxis response regulator CheB
MSNRARGQRTTPIRVLVVDDSPLMRQMLAHVLGEADDIEVVGVAEDALNARSLIKRLDPDVVTLDVMMPGMDGLSFLHKIMALRPTPVVMVSDLTERGSAVSLEALEIGAVEVIAKSSFQSPAGAAEVVRAVCMAAGANLGSRLDGPVEAASPRAPDGRYRPSARIVVVGASAGGVEAVRRVLAALPENSPGMVIVQHMPVAFTKKFAKRLDSLCAVSVTEAEDKAVIAPGRVYIAPGDRHVVVVATPDGFVCRLRDGPLVSGHKPSVDVLFESTARAAGRKAVGVILTGMGNDGAEGLKAMRTAGALTLGQDEASSMIYGMPRAAHEAGAVTRQLPLRKIPKAILDACVRRRPASRERS